MDTDDLSDLVYDAILGEAEEFDHNLTLQFGLLADSCKNEGDYIKEALQLIQAIKEADDEEIDDVFFGEPPSRKDLNICLDKIINNIKEAGGNGL